MALLKKIYIEITNHCNLSCSFCPSTRRARAFMRPEVFFGILEKIEGHTQHLYLHVRGEPLLHPDLGFLLDAAGERGFRVNLTTNGTLLAQSGDLLLAKSALRQINISLHCCEHLAAPDTVQCYLDAVLAFIRAAGDPPRPFINLRLWNLQEPAAEPTRKILARLRDVFDLPAPILRALPGAVTLAPRIFLSGERRFVWPHAQAPDRGDRGRCRGLLDHLGILVDGTVVPCCLDAEADIPLGNILQEDLADIMSRRRVVAMREGFRRGRIVEPLCRRCGFRERFRIPGDQEQAGK